MNMFGGGGGGVGNAPVSGQSNFGATGQFAQSQAQQQAQQQAPRGGLFGGINNAVQQATQPMGLVSGPVQSGGLFGGGGAAPQQAGPVGYRNPMSDDSNMPHPPSLQGLFGDGGANGLQQPSMFGGSGASGPQSINPVGISETGLGGPTPQWYRTLATAQPMGLVNSPMQGGFPGLGPQAAPQQNYGGLLGGGGAGPAYAQPMGFLGGGGGANGPQQAGMFGGSTSNAPQTPRPVNQIGFSGGAGQGGQQNPGGLFGGGAGPAYAGMFSGNNNAPSMPRLGFGFAKGGSVGSAQGLASLGRGDDKMLVHMTPGEVHGLQRLAMAHGGSLTINPHTGLPEAGFLSSLLPMALGAGLVASGVGAPMAALMVGGGYGLATGSLAKGLQAGLGAYGGAGIGEGLATLGGQGVGAGGAGTFGEQAAIQEAQQQAARQATENLVSTGANTTGLIPGTETAGYFGPEAGMNMDMAKGYGYTPPGFESAPVAAPAPMPTTQPIASAAELAADNAKMPGMQPPIEAPSRFDQMLSGAQKAYDKPMDFLKTKGIPSAIASAAAPLVSSTLSGMIQPQGLQGLVPQTTSAPNYPNYSFQQTRNPKFGQPGEAYYIQNYVKMASGGAIASSLPNLRGNYPGSNINQTSYSSMPSTNAQEIVDGYGPKIDPFTGEQGMAKGGVASDNLADFKMYSDENETSGVEDLSATQLEAAADSDDAYLMGSASLERDRRKASGTKGYKRKEFAHGGMASLPEYAAGGKLLRGPGDGMSDDIPAVINGPKPQRAALADGEFVVPADVVSHLGNGSTDAGAKRLYAMMDKVRHARTGNKKQGRQIKAERFLPA